MTTAIELALAWKTGTRCPWACAGPIAQTESTTARNAAHERNTHIAVPTTADASRINDFST